METPVYLRRVKTSCKEGNLDVGLQLLDTMERQGTWALLEAYACLLHVCINLQSMAKGKQVHCYLVKNGCKVNQFIYNNLVTMYAKCGSIHDARKVFNDMQMRNVFTYTALITGYVQQSNSKESLQLFLDMQDEGIKPDKVSFASVLKACSGISFLQHGKHIHASILKTECQGDAFVTSTLIDMYAKCATLEDARSVFDRMNYRTIVSWNLMIGGYVQHGKAKAALMVFHQMQQENMKPEHITIVNLLRACTSMLSMQEGKWVHAVLLRSGLQIDVFVGSNLIDMYAKCGGIKEASQEFILMPIHSVVPWNIMILGYVSNSDEKTSLWLFKQMPLQNMKPDKITIVEILIACTNTSALEHGKLIHANALEAGFHLDTFVSCSLLDMYAKCGSLDDVSRVFDSLLERDVISWNIIIAAHAEQDGAHAIRLFAKMRHQIEPNNVSFVNAINACAAMKCLTQGKLIHANALSFGCNYDIFVGNAVMDMYVKCESLEEAYQMFNSFSLRNVVSWSVMASSYALHGSGDGLMTLFHVMESEGAKPDSITFLSVLNACSSLGALQYGRWAHTQTIRSGHFQEVYVGSALVDMYVKCGNIEDAVRVFDRLPARNTATWSAIIAGYGEHGNGKAALSLLWKMLHAGIKPNQVTFTSCLSACSHSCLLNEGCHFFSLISHGFLPVWQHFSCLADLLGRSGCLNETADFVNVMPFEPPYEIWKSFINACRVYDDIEPDGIVKIAES